MGEAIVRELGNDRYALLYLKWITSKDLLFSTGNSPQYSVWKKNLKQNGYMYIYNGITSQCS